MKVSPTIEQRYENERNRVKRITRMLATQRTQLLTELKDRVEGLKLRYIYAGDALDNVLAIIDEFMEGGK